MTITFTTEQSARRQRHIIDALRFTPMTAPELGRAVFMGRSAMCEYLRHMHGTGAIHITCWRRGRVPVYAAGAGVDAPVPKPTTGPERRRIFMQRVYADPHRHDQFKAARRLKWRIVTMIDRRRNVPAILRGLI